MYSACRELLCRTVYLKKDCATRGAGDCAARADLHFEILRLACFKIDIAQRHHYSMFDVGRSMFDVQAGFATGNRCQIWAERDAPVLVSITPTLPACFQLAT